MSLFDEVNLAEITHPDYPGERLIACRNPALAGHRAHKREALLAATETELAKIADAVTAGRLADAAAIGTRYGKVIGRHKMGKHFTVHIAEGVFTAVRNPTAIDAEAALDGIYVIRTCGGWRRCPRPPCTRASSTSAALACPWPPRRLEGRQRCRWSRPRRRDPTWPWPRTWSWTPPPPRNAARSNYCTPPFP